MELAVSAAYLGGYSGNDMFYSENWTYGILQKIIERGSLKPVMEKPRGFDLSLNYMLTKDMGIQFRFDYNLKAGLTNAGKSSYNLNFQWADTTIGGLSKEWALTGDVALANISANFIYKYPASTRVLPFISAGLTLQAGRLKAGTSGGYAWSWFVPGETDTMQVIDFIDIPLELKSSFNKIGLNLGGGMDLFLSPQVALTIDARYFIAQKTKLKWQVQPGKYVFNNFNQWTFTVDTASALQIEDGIEPYMLNTSFYRISVGLKFVF